MVDHKDDWAGERGKKWLSFIEPLEAMLSPVNDLLVSSLPISRPANIAEIGSGSGASAAHILASAPKGCFLHGYDISPDLLAYARQRSELQHKAVEFFAADVSCYQPPQLYDYLFSRFGVMFFADPLKAFTQLRQWMQPGAQFVFAVWGDFLE